MYLPRISTVKSVGWAVLLDAIFCFFLVYKGIPPTEFQNFKRRFGLKKEKNANKGNFAATVQFVYTSYDVRAFGSAAPGEVAVARVQRGGPRAEIAFRDIDALGTFELINAAPTPSSYLNSRTHPEWGAAGAVMRQS